MKQSKIQKLIFCSLFTALTAAATLAIRIPSPVGGYINAGDALVLYSAWTLGLPYAMFAAGVGSCLADLFSGYALFAPCTFAVKALTALTAKLVFDFLNRKNGDRRFITILKRVTAGAAGELIMIGGYFAYTALILGVGAGAAAEIPGNAVQALFGVAAATALSQMRISERIMKY